MIWKYIDAIIVCLELRPPMALGFFPVSAPLFLFWRKSYTLTVKIMIELRSFSKSYSSKSAPAVSDFSMTCAKGEITGLLGLNGAGKTTILKAICARHFATSGEVLVEGVNASENAEAVRNLTGFITEEPNLPPEYTVAEFLNMVAQLHGQEKKPRIHTNEHGQEKSPSPSVPPTSKNKESVISVASVLSASNTSSASICVHPRLIDSLSLTELLPKKLRTLSKGQRERVNFAQALIYNPSVLVLDEPASGLDPAQILSMRALVRSLKASHTILLSTHLMQEVEALCDRVYIIHEGKFAASGTPSEIAAAHHCKNLEEAFFLITKQTDSAKTGAEENS